MDEHRGHDTVTAVAEWTEKQKQLGHNQLTFQQRIQRREKDVQELRKALKTFNSFAQTAVGESEKMFSEMILSINRRRSEVIKQIRAEEKAEVSRAEGHLKQLEQEIAELKRREAELEKLSHTEDYIHTLKTFKSISAPPASKDLPNLFVNQIASFESVKRTVSVMKNQLQDICRQKINVLPKTVSAPGLPKTREDLLKCYTNFTLDPNTAFKELHLSERNTKVDNNYHKRREVVPDHPERFDWKEQVLCRESVIGRCYWEVNIRTEAHVAVSYKEISRKGNDTGFGENSQSWSMVFRSDNANRFQHNKNTQPFRKLHDRNARVGVYVDHGAGTLAFFHISDKITLLHRVQTTFTQPLYPGFLVYGGQAKLLHTYKHMNK